MTIDFKSSEFCLMLEQSTGTYETQRTDLGSQGGGGTDFTSRRPEVDDLDFVGVLEKRRFQRVLYCIRREQQY